MRYIANSDCDGAGSKCNCHLGEVRFLPTGSQPSHGGLYLCRAHFDVEIRYRAERNRELSPECRFKLPAWETLQTKEEKYS